MIEEILDNLYRMEIPLPGSPLKAVNSYVIRDSERSLIVDTGLNRPECLEAMQTGLSRLGVALSKADFFVTHLHADHFALVSKLATNTSRIYFNKPDAERREKGSWDDMVSHARVHGFPEQELREALHRHPGYRYGAKLDFPLILLDDGDPLAMGDYAFQCVETRGHTAGHMCLYESRRKILLSGDHILSDITPNIQLWSDNGNPLKDYLSSLDKVRDMDVEMVLPGHRRVFRNCRARIDELKDHHARRAQEVLTILAQAPATAFEVASRMSWDIDCESWEQFPVAQKWFATGEAIAHLKYLEEQGQVCRRGDQNRVVYSRA